MSKGGEPGRVDILIQGSDFKVAQWRRVLDAQGARLHSIRKGLWMVTDFLSYLWRHGRPKALVLRYFNDRKSLSGSLRLACGEAFCIGLCKIIGVRLIWICHNVDKETIEYHPRLTRWRRALAGWAAARVLVMDPLLIGDLNAHLPHVSHKSDWLTFGPPAPAAKPAKAEPAIADIEAFVKAHRARAYEAGHTPLIGLCLGAAGPKYIHLDYARALVHAASGIGFRIGLVVAGDYSRHLSARQQAEVAALAADAEILFIPRFVDVDERSILHAFDFFWRGYTDSSISYTLHVAAAVGKPVLALECGFVARAVKAYGLGATVHTDFHDLPEALERLMAWDRRKADDFNTARTWEAGARRLCAAALEGHAQTGAVESALSHE